MRSSSIDLLQLDDSHSPSIHQLANSPDPRFTRSPIRQLTNSPTHQFPESVDRPRLRNVELLEQPDGVTIGHAGDEVPRCGVETVLVDRAWVQEFGRPFANLVPQSRK